MDLSDEIKSSIRAIQDYPKAGVLFRDITPLLADAALTRRVVAHMSNQYRDQKVDFVAGIEARGFIFGSMLAHELGCGFVPVRKVGKLPYQTLRQRYDLEYGTAEIEVHVDAFGRGKRVLIHDDVLATGGTASAAGQLVQTSGAEIVAFSFLINLGFLPGEETLRKRFGMTPDFLVKY